nr:hypothetical protein Ade03nite_84370 [Actinoplanes derwentensis]
MAEPLGDLMDAVAGVEQIRGEHVPDLMRSEGPDLRGDSDLVEPVGEVVRVGLTRFDGQGRYVDLSQAA